MYTFSAGKRKSVNGVHFQRWETRKCKWGSANGVHYSAVTQNGEANGAPPPQMKEKINRKQFLNEKLNENQTRVDSGVSGGR